VIAVLDSRVVITEQAESLHAINWPKTLLRYVLKQWGGDIQTMPLLIPLNIQHAQADKFMTKLNHLGFKVTMSGPDQCVVREQPRFLQGLTLSELPLDVLSLSDDKLKQWFGEQWAKAHSGQYRDIEKTLASCDALSHDIISSKHYMPDLLV